MRLRVTLLHLQADDKGRVGLWATICHSPIERLKTIFYMYNIRYPIPHYVFFTFIYSISVLCQFIPDSYVEKFSFLHPNKDTELPLL